MNRVYSLPSRFCPRPPRRTRAPSSDPSPNRPFFIRNPLFPPRLPAPIFGSPPGRGPLNLFAEHYGWPSIGKSPSACAAFPLSRAPASPGASKRGLPLQPLPSLHFIILSLCSLLESVHDRPNKVCLSLSSCSSSLHCGPPPRTAALPSAPPRPAIYFSISYDSHTINLRLPPVATIPARTRQPVVPNLTFLYFGSGCGCNTGPLQSSADKKAVLRAPPRPPQTKKPFSVDEEP